jgi:hypothetical protein
VTSLASFGGKKGKTKEKDKDGGFLAVSKKDRKASGDKDKSRLSSFLSSSSSGNNNNNDLPADAAMASSTYLSSSMIAPSGRLSTSESGSIRVSSTSMLRHVRSGSNLNDGSPPLSERPMGRRVGLGIVRGMSVRAGRLVRGLDAALDFVDPR